MEASLVLVVLPELLLDVAVSKRAGLRSIRPLAYTQPSSILPLAKRTCLLYQTTGEEGALKLLGHLL